QAKGEEDDVGHGKRHSVLFGRRERDARRINFPFGKTGRTLRTLYAPQRGLASLPYAGLRS
ncbi:hypothetical protein ABTA75_18930, partial [Acinetobacter baumannii]